MKKRIVSLWIAFSMLTALAPNTLIGGVSASMTAADTERRLAAAEVYDESDILTKDYEFHYSGKFLTEVKYNTYDQDGSSAFNTVLTYDADGRLVSRISGDPDTPGMNSGRENTYNESGQLVSSRGWEGGVVETDYEYDAAGNLIREIEEYDAGSTITEYWYREDGVLSSASATYDLTWTGEVWTETITYSYDAQGRLSQMSCTGGSTESVTTYSYEYRPFILSEETNESGYSNFYLYLEDDNGETLYSIVLFDPVLQTNADGYLTSVSDSSRFGDTLHYIFHYEDIPAETQNDEQAVHFQITTDHTNLSVRKDNAILFGAGLNANGEQLEDISGITFQIEDDSVLTLSSSFSKENNVYASFLGLKEGTTKVLFHDSNSGAAVKIPVTVYSNTYLSYTLSSVPTQEIEKYPTNFYDVNGLYIDSYSYHVNSDQSATVSFEVYNAKYTYGAVEVYDVNGNLHSAVLIDKMHSSMTSMKEILWDDVVYLVRDIADGDMLSYRQESGFSKQTSVSVTIPKNGYIKICNDPENSFIVNLVNSADLLLSIANFMGQVKGFDTNSKVFSEKLTAKLITEKTYAEFVKDANEWSKKLWTNVGKESVSSQIMLTDFCETVVNNLYELDLEDVIISTGMEIGIAIGEDTFAYFAGPFGIALNGIFAIGSMENIVVQEKQLVDSAGIGVIRIQNQGGGILGAQQITVESEDGFEAETALRVFSVSVDPELLGKIEKGDRELYAAISMNASYIYHISLLQNGEEIQPGNKVTVCIPIPEKWNVPMPDDLKQAVYSGIFRVYRIEEDGSTTQMDIDVQNGCFVFQTDHFSLYALARFDFEGYDDLALFRANWPAPVFVGTGVVLAALLIMAFLHPDWKKRKVRKRNR